MSERAPVILELAAMVHTEMRSAATGERYGAWADVSAAAGLERFTLRHLVLGA